MNRRSTPGPGPLPGNHTSDPRTIVTPDAFHVHPNLLGIPLASHSRRVGAILVDLLVIALVSRAGGLVLGLLAAAFLLRVTFRRKANGTPSIMETTFRGLVGCLGGTVLLVTVLVVAWGIVGSHSPGPAGPDRPGRTPEGVVTSPGVRGVIGGAVEGARYMRAEDGEEARLWAEALADRARRIGLEEEEIRELLAELTPDGAPWRDEVAGWDLGPAEDEDAPEEDAPPGEEPGEAIPIPPALADTLRTLEERLAEEVRERERAEAELLEAGRALREREEELRRAGEGRGIRAFLREMAEDLGLGFGWAALYFTVFTTWWRGRTPGKRLFGIRVVRLTGEPLNWWTSFERYGGYWAGFATGLLGFAQVYWDPNRQAIHDRIGKTVVIRDKAPPVPGNWTAAASTPERGRSSDPRENP